VLSDTKLFYKNFKKHLKKEYIIPFKHHIALQDIFKQAIDDNKIIKVSTGLISRNYSNDFDDIPLISNGTFVTKDTINSSFFGFVSNYEILDADAIRIQRIASSLENSIKSISMIKNEQVNTILAQYHMAMQEAAMHQRTINRIMTEANDDKYTSTLIDNVLNGINAIAHHPLSYAEPMVSED
jgi:hypothetical protein